VIKLKLVTIVRDSTKYNVIYYSDCYNQASNKRRFREILFEAPESARLFLSKILLRI